ncbi:MAG: DNA mismatch repair protein MutS, partial [Bacteroidetes bacterium]|nr:DNA mismatch repair protein MutS [Bacteroidota bacterium]
MHDDKDFDVQQSLPSNSQDLVQDLELKTLINAMSLDDSFLSDIVTKAILNGLNSVEEVKYRQ